MRWNLRKEVLGSVSRFVRRKKENFVFELTQEIINKPAVEKAMKPTGQESTVEQLICEDIDTELIKKQHISQVLKEELISKNQKNHIGGEDELIFYTDGSMKSLHPGKSTAEMVMGAGWVQVDSEEGIVLDKGKIGARNWPSSTKAELLAIWYVLLLVPRKKKVKIYTDSAAAIAGLNKGKKLKSNKQWLKEKYYDLKKSIIKVARFKEISLDLIKVKGHSNSRWNREADSLAKEGTVTSSLDRIVTGPPPSSVISLCWEETHIEELTRQFVKDMLDFKAGAEWRFSSLISKLEPESDKEEHSWPIFWRKANNRVELDVRA